jgi:hypothetical protein
MEVIIMSCIVYQVNKKTGIKYAYESISYWDKEKQQPRSKRKYLGRVDSDTGEIIRENKGDNSAEKTKKDNGLGELNKLREELENKDKRISELTAQLEYANKKNDELSDAVRKLRLFIAEEFSDV